CHRDVHLHRNAPSRLQPEVEQVTGFGPPAGRSGDRKQGTEHRGAGPHPGFRSLKNDPGNVKFNHWLHLQPGIATADARPTQKKKLSDLDEAWRGHYAAYSKDDGLLQLDCAACHQPESPGGASMQPIAFQTHCQACHRLEVSVSAGQVAEVPHGLSADRLTMA